MFRIKDINNIISTYFEVFQGSCYPLTKSSRTKMIIFEQSKDQSKTKALKGTKKSFWDRGSVYY